MVDVNSLFETLVDAGFTPFTATNLLAVWMKNGGPNQELYPQYATAIAADPDSRITMTRYAIAAFNTRGLDLQDTSISEIANARI